jgi:type I restriction enzyme S subunit
MAEWLDESLAEVLDFREGPGILARDFRTDGIPLIRLAGVKSRNSILEGCNYLDPEMVERKWSHFRLAAHDVVLSTSASLGEVKVVDSEGVGCIPYTGLIRFRTRDERRVLQRFVPLALTSSTFKAQIQAMGAGSVLKHFGPMHLRQMTLRLPPAPVQVAITDIIESIDNRIESARRQIALLESLGSALLDSVLPVNTFGEPEYEEVPLGEFLDVLETGSRPRGGVRADTEGVVSLGAENVQSAGIITSRDFKRVPGEFVEKMRRGILMDDDVLVYKDGGKPGNFIPHVSAFGHNFPVRTATINEHVYRVRAVPEIGQGLLYWILRSAWMDQEMRKRGTGVAIPGLNSTNFKQLPFPRLADTDRDRLRVPLTAALDSMLRCGAEMAILNDLRGSVLSGLMTGELEIADVKASIA